MEQGGLFALVKNMEKQSQIEIGHESTFQKFWEHYPKRRAKAQAKKAWDKLVLTRSLFAEIIEAIEAQKLTPDWQKNEGQFIPLPATWINGRRWEDEIIIGSANRQVQRSNKCHKCGTTERTQEINKQIWCIDCYQKFA